MTSNTDRSRTVHKRQYSLLSSAGKM